MQKGLHWTIRMCAVTAIISTDVAVAATGWVGEQSSFILQKTSIARVMVPLTPLLPPITSKRNSL